MSQIIPKVDAAALASVAALAGDNIITEDELSLSRAGSQGGFHFDGSNDYQDVTTDDFGTSDFSLCYDLLWDDAPSGVEYLSRRGGNNRWGLYVTATTFVFEIEDGVGATNSYTWTVTPSTNHRNVIVTADRSGNATLYLNGESQGTQDISGDSAVDLGSGNINNTRLGYTSSSFDGRMYQVRFYSDVLTTAEVKELAKGNHVSDNLWLHYSPVSTTESGWRDLSENDRNSINNGATRIESAISKSYVGEDEAIQNKVVGPAYYFDGVNDSIENTSFNVAGGKWTWMVICKVNDLDGTHMIVTEALSTSPRAYLAFNVSSQLIVKIADGTIDSTKTFDIGTVIGEQFTLLVTFNNETGYKIFRDGVLLHNESLTWDDFTPNNHLEIGTYNNQSATGPFYGEISTVRAFNRALTDSEALDVSHGKSLGYADSDHADGTAAYSSDFSAGVDSWANNTGTIVTGDVDSIGGENDTLHIEGNSAGGFHIAQKLTSFTVGKRYRVSFRYYLPSANTNIDGFVVTSQTQSAGVFVDLTAGATTDSWTTYTAEFTANTVNMLIYLSDGGTFSFTDVGDDLYIKDFTVTAIGEVLSLLPSGIASGKWFDQGPGGYHGTLTGATPINQRKRGVFDTLYLDNVPSSDAGLSTGEVYRDNNGHLKIVI